MSGIESKLFELMRDGVITDLTRVSRNIGTGVNSSNVVDTWRCAVHTTTHGVELFESSSAPGAYMTAYSHIMTMKLTDQQIYSTKVLAKRRKLGLE